MRWYYSRSQKKLWHGGTDGSACLDWKSALWSCDADDTAVPGLPAPLPLGNYPYGPVKWNQPEDAEPSGELWSRSMGPGYIIIGGAAAPRGIYTHGGGSGVAFPLAARQGITPTENCIRVNNEDLYHIGVNVGDGSTDTIEYVA
jgi:hypothetical protein